MSRNNYNQPPPPPYGSPVQSSYPAVPAAPSGSTTDPRLPLYYEHHRHHHRYKPSDSTRNSAGVIAIPVHVQPVHSAEHVVADARTFDRFWSALFLGFFVWLLIMTFTDGIELLRLAVIGLAGALKEILDHILRELRQAGWDV